MKLTEKQAYRAMRDFLEIYYKDMKSDDLGDILSWTELTKDGGTMDPACWFEWIECINEREEDLPINLTVLEAYKAMIDFLVVYSQEIKSENLGDALSGMLLTKDKQQTMDPYAWLVWISSINKIKGKEFNLTSLEAYKIMAKFLDIYYKSMNSKDVGDLLAAMELTGDDKITKDPEVWQNWIRSIEKVLSEKSE